MIESNLILWALAGIFASLLFFAAVLLLILSVQQKQRGLLLPVAILGMTYFSLQCMIAYLCSSSRDSAALKAVTTWFVSLPPWIIVLFFVLTGAVLLLLNLALVKRSLEEITPMSVKEAADSLPAGMCFYLSDGRILLVNQAMEDFFREITGNELTNGRTLRDTLFSGDLGSGCRREMLESVPILTLSDGTVWSISERHITYQEEPVAMLFTNNVTELYQKTLSLQSLREQLGELNQRLTEYNREIVAMTAEKELLSARVRLHDEMGADLLTIRRYMEHGGTEQEQADIEARLRRNVTFLLTGQASVVRDEYELMLETAEHLGVSVQVEGTLPETGPQKHIVATAIHECCTNTLRHAHGDELTLQVEERDGQICVRFTNNGDQPAGNIQERGGLASLRSLVEQLPGGEMEISVSPRFVIQLTLPKEVPNVF